MARKYHYVNGHPERFRIITFEGAFHGRTLATIAATGNAKYLEGFGPKVDGFDQVPFGDLAAVEAAIGPETGAILVEPIQGEGGIRVFPRRCLRGLRELCDRHGLLLVYDEVQCGMGRTGKLFAYEHAGAVPDIMTSAKGIGGGFPLGACLATAEAAKGMTVGTHGTTYGGNPLAMACGNAVLDVVLGPGFLDQVARTGLFLKQRLAELEDHHPQDHRRDSRRGFDARPASPGAEQRFCRRRACGPSDRHSRRRQCRAPAAAAHSRRGHRRRGHSAPRKRLPHARKGALSGAAGAPAMTATSAPPATRHFLDLSEIPADVLRRVLTASGAMKAKRVRGRPAGTKPLAGKVLAMIFDRPSTRTRVSFDIGMRELGGETIMLTGAEMQLGRGETIADTARVMSRYVDAIMIRILDHDDMMEMARHATVPVINGLTKRSHPCQVMADVLTFEEHRGPIKGRTVAWSGDSNNVLASWIHAAQRFDFAINVATPPELSPPKMLLDWAKAHRVALTLTDDPFAAVKGADGRDLRLLGLDGRRRGGAPSPQSAGALPGQCQADGRSRRGRDLHALPARSSRRGSHRRRHRRPAIGRLRRGGEPAARAESHPRLVPGSDFGMSGEVRPVPVRPVDDRGRDDMVLPFAVEPLDLRGRVVRLGPSIDRIVARHAYPPPVARLVGEAAALTALLGASLKFEGRLQLQTKSDGVADMLVVDFDAPDRLRAFARYDAGRLAAAPASTPADLLGSGHLALTIDQGGEASRYQGIVALEGQGLEAAAHRLFPSIGTDPDLGQIGGRPEYHRGRRRLARRRLDRAIPSGVRRAPAPERPRSRRCAAGRVGTLPTCHEDDAWVEAKALAATLEDHELVDPTLSSERLLYRLFHERGVRVFEPQPLRDACRCSRERIAAMLASFTRQERADMVGEDGRIGVTCEFCSTYRAFDPAGFDPQ